MLPISDVPYFFFEMLILPPLAVHNMLLASFSASFNKAQGEDLTESLTLLKMEQNGDLSQK